MSGVRQRLRAPLVAAGAALTAALLAANRPNLPPPQRLGELGGWIEATGPDRVVMAGVHAIAFAVAVYLAVVTGAGFAARLLGSHRTVRLLDRLSVPAVRRVLAPVGVAAVLAAGTAPAAALPHRAPAAESATTAGLPPPALLVVSSDRAGDPPRALLVPAGAAPTRLDPPAASPGPGPLAVDGGPLDPAGRAPGGLHTVRPGEHFWSIAEQLVAERLGRAPRDAEIVPTWRALIEANRDRLAVPGDPDLLFPGQVLLLP